MLGMSWTVRERLLRTRQSWRVESQTEREEYFVGWTHGYVNRAEGIEEEREDSVAKALPEQRIDLGV
jgi:hypothetical protein